MSYGEKIDTFDLIIEVLKEHERALDELVAKFEHAAEHRCNVGFSYIQSKILDENCLI